MLKCIECGKQKIKRKIKGTNGIQTRYCSPRCQGEAKLKRMKARGAHPCGGCKKLLPLTEFGPRSLRNHCRKCSSRYDNLRAYRLKQKAIDLLGGKCSSCGFNKHPAAIDLHHTDPSKKEISWAILRKRTWEFISATITKEACILLCANCHRIEHHSSLVKVSSWHF